jgi:hypothetical protein
VVPKERCKGYARNLCKNLEYISRNNEKFDSIILSVSEKEIKKIKLGRNIQKNLVLMTVI